MKNVSILRHLTNFFSPYQAEILFILLFGISFISFGVAYMYNTTTAYMDATSHLNIARRIFDNQTPGLGQLGSAWLPLFHLLLAPFVMNNWIYHIGVAGYMVNFFLFVMSGLVFFLILRKWFAKHSLWPFFFTLLFALNPNILYMHTVAMGEILLIFTMLTSIYFLQKFFLMPTNIAPLIISAIFTFLATLNRYEGWFLALVQVISVFAVVERKRGRHVAESYTILFAVLACFGIGLWLLYNLIIFNDPLDFLHSIYSAQGQQNVIWKDGNLLTKDNILLSLATYFYAAVHNVGWIFLLVAVICLPLIFIKKRFVFNVRFLIVGLLLSPALFEIFSLFRGITVIYVPEFPPYKLFNIRYGLLIYPGLIALIAYFFSRYTLYVVKTLIALFLIVQLGLLYTRLPITLEDPLTEMQRANARSQVLAAEYLKSHYHSGNILIAAGALDPVMFYSEIPLKEFVHEGNKNIWTESLIEPSKRVRYIVVSKGNASMIARDTVANHMLAHPELLKPYRFVFSQDAVDIYELQRPEKR